MNILHPNFKRKFHNLKDSTANNEVMKKIEKEKKRKLTAC